jgi:hypothetical protein
LLGPPTRLLRGRGCDGHRCFEIFEAVFEGVESLDCQFGPLLDLAVDRADVPGVSPHRLHRGVEFAEVALDGLDPLVNPLAVGSIGRRCAVVFGFADRWFVVAVRFESTFDGTEATL